MTGQGRKTRPDVTCEAPLMLLNRDQILKADDLPTEEVPVPEWGGTVRVRGLTAREAVEYQESLVVERGGQRVQDVANAEAKLVAYCVVDEDGKPVFTRNDAAALGEKSAVGLERVFEVAARLSGLDEGAVEAAGKGSPPTPPAGSRSVSPATSGAPTRTRSSKRSPAGS